MNKTLICNDEAMLILTTMAQEGRKDAEIQDALTKEFNYTWSLGTIRNIRVKKLGIKKTNSHTVDSFSTPGDILDQENKSDWYRNKFRKTHFFKQLSKQCTKQEVEVYIEEYGKICCQFEDIVTTEFIQIDDFLKHRILISREMNSMNQYRKQIDVLTSKLFLIKPIETSTREQKEEYRKGNDELRELRVLLDKSLSRYGELVKNQDKIFAGLAATRKDRMKEMRGSGQTFFELIEEIQKDKNSRKDHGKYAEMTKFAGEDMNKVFRKKHTFPNKTRDNVILDSLCDKKGGENE